MREYTPVRYDNHFYAAFAREEYYGEHHYDLHRTYGFVIMEKERTLTLDEL